MLMTLRDGSETHFSKLTKRTEQDIRRDGEVLGWLGSDGSLSATIDDRLNTKIVNRLPDGTTYAWGPLWLYGFEHLPLEGALALGFSTTEYQAALRYRILTGCLLQTEEELAAEILPPADQEEMFSREGFSDWEEVKAVRRVPYPLEENFQLYEAVGWAKDEKGEIPEDRFQRRIVFRERETGELFKTRYTLRDCGIEGLSLRDVLLLGFTTTDYRTALQVRLLERRHIFDESDLEQSRNPPYEVLQGLEQYGRQCSYRREAPNYADGKVWDAVKQWMYRIQRPKLKEPVSTPFEALLDRGFRS